MNGDSADTLGSYALFLEEKIKDNAAAEEMYLRRFPYPG